MSSPTPPNVSFILSLSAWSGSHPSFLGVDNIDAARCRNRNLRVSPSTDASRHPTEYNRRHTSSRMRLLKRLATRAE